jgi:hypothetical protein
MTTPEWAASRGGEVRVSKDGQSWLLYLGGEPQYLLLLSPAEGKYGCRVEQTNSGRRLGSGAAYPTPEAALRGGLEDLRKALGW